ncbi:MAG: hypothetical protein ACI8RZ_005599 [Myxococcota bacterium]|jgi:hypothetical protein
MSQTLHGHCYCGGVTFTVQASDSAPPVFTAYCHCDSCRRAHAAPLYQVVGVRADQHTITAGADLIRDFQRPGKSIVRSFCTVCGSRIYNRLSHLPPERAMIIFFPDLLDEAQRKNLPASFLPRHNNAAGECVLEAELLREVLSHSATSTDQ